ncbi:hypothetical protein [Salinimicrobium sp. GXAS 041]|uniref:hypothetical protein n=1 Tax=Salinimicrobium sp. GXAS 041 TaxID=3400806 RepID=UPI003C765D65
MNLSKELKEKRAEFKRLQSLGEDNEDLRNKITELDKILKQIDASFGSWCSPGGNYRKMSEREEDFRSI